MFKWLRGLFRAPPTFTYTDEDLRALQAAEAKRKRRQEKRRNG